MYVCLCMGVSNTSVADAIEAGASTTNEVAAACGAGSECGRCRRTVRAIIDSHRGAAASPPVRDAGDRR
jgi:bacterioferritin-associated ferredoxin